MDGIFDKNENFNLKLIAVKLTQYRLIASTHLSPTACTHTFIVIEIILTYTKVRKQCKQAQLSFHINTDIRICTFFIYKVLF